MPTCGSGCAARTTTSARSRRQAADLLASIEHEAGPITRTRVDRMAAHLGFSLVHTSDLPSSTRSVTDLANRRVYLPQPEAGQHDSRSLALQALGSRRARAPGAG